MRRVLGVVLIELFVLAPAAWGWQHEYRENFSADPGWVTNDPAMFYWTADQNYHGKQTDCEDQSAYKLLECGSLDGSFGLEFDIRPTVDWAGNINIGLFGQEMTSCYWGTAIDPTPSLHIMFSVDDNGQHIHMIANDVGDGCHISAGSFPEQGVWYHCRIVYDSNVHRAHFEVSKEGSVVAEATQFELGQLPGIDRIAWSGIGDQGYCGQAGEAEIDNIVLLYDCSPSPSPIRESTWGEVKSLYH